MASFFKPPRFLMRDRASPRTITPESRTVTCYRCAQKSTVSGFAESASCPHCAGNLRLLPIHITKGHWGSSVMTTESVHVEENAKLIANLVIASNDILIEGVVEAMCICGGIARLTPTGILKGGIRATQLIIEPGAAIEGSIVEAPSIALGSVDVDAASRARPGTGPAAQIEFKHLTSPNLAQIPAQSITPPPTSPPLPTSPPRLRV
ncbi:MAG: polymer-forming cytoskeletal protein, partial [Phycisphaerales bacterium]